MTTTFSIRIDEQTKERLERLAKSTSRSRAYLAAEAIREYVELNEWQIAEIEKAVREADEPRAVFIDHEEIEAKWQAEAEREEAREHTLESKRKHRPR